MSSYPQRPVHQNYQRLNELLDAIKEEFENVNNEASSFRLHKNEYDLKFNQQTSEMQQIRQTVYDLEMAHRKIKEAYEDQINRLKNELELKDRQLASIQQQQQQNPNQPLLSNASLAPIPSQPQQQTPYQEAKPTATPSGGAASAGYLVPANQRATHAKQIPPFLHDLESTSVPAHLRKLQPEYYILYNPSLPKTVDVELVHSLDHSSVVCCVRFSNDGKFLATGCNKTTQVFGVETGELVARLADDNTASENGNSGADLYIRSVCFSPDGKFLATGAEDKVIRIWDLSTRRITKYLKGHEQDIYSLDFFPDGNRLVSGSGDRTVRIWDLQSGQCSLTLSIEDGVTTVAVSPDGKLVAAGSLDRTVRVWDSSTGFLVERLDSENEAGTGHKDSVYSVAFTSDGSEVASGSLDRTVKLWSLKQLGNGTSSNTQSKNVTACEVTYVGHKDFVLSVCSSPDSQYILSGSKDRGVIFWEKKTGDPLLMLQGHRNSVISVSVANNAISGAGMFATGSGDCKARIWRWNKVQN
ncbi:hypothetical protein WICANDRAFT_34664 [Wickerhamomyces anomalus NRRL Y-366-8]|uniref:Transcriptional repressor Tup1 N-terminal domain-containing protein n=1 Tax=Wickerhamomyces anomalus (strain ATCC 58044 / CBS 1984 / NCYC 433 / NRRL Y-366-8) TaxID=683960 RepID=A0A1E3NZ95_WICAA|nr:uncharacterized protein WICANDRAFT_34664 [Wickerhamomyces anomalus NRRL Y-366-8]ODQ57927.1 hypothetical protein WICANDRAFT_34664 [Wickerhamomyces anomalus NRRL Y-366-8]